MVSLCGWQMSLMVSILPVFWSALSLIGSCCFFSVDGNGWSSRFSRLLMSGSVVIKHTLFPEWHHVSIFPAVTCSCADTCDNRTT